MRLAWMALLCFITITARAFAPRAACWTDGAETRLAALADGRLHLGRVTAGGIVDLGTLPTPNLTTLAVGQWRGAPALLGAGGKTLQRFDAGRQRWVALGTAGAPIRELHPAPDRSPRALLLTGTSNDPAKNQGAVWWADWRTACRLTRVAAVKDTYRPWQLCWTQLPGEQRFAIAAYKATPMADFPHNCMFVFAWHDHTAETSVDEVLEEAVGNAAEIWVVVPIQGKLRLTRGAVFTYYEFKHPAADRMTDEAWQQRIRKGNPAPLPGWVRSFLLGPGPNTPVPAYEMSRGESGC